MATAVDNSSIASAKERAASILYGNERPIPPLINEYKPTTPVVAEYSVPVKEEPKAKPTLSGYYHIETARQERQPAQLRSYEPVYEAPTMRDPQVLRPFIDANQIAEVPETVIEEAPVAVTSKSVKSEIDVELEEDTQYVVRFKTPTIIAAAAIAVIFFLMAVLFIVNIVSLSSNAAMINKLTNEQQTLDQELNQVIGEIQAEKDKVLGELDFSNYEDLTIHTVDKNSVDFYTPSTTTSGNNGFFDWVCKSLSGLFS